MFFDYVFYRVCKAYSQTNDSSPEAAAAIVVAMMQFFNLLSIIMLIEIMRHDKSLLNKTYAVIVVLVFMIANYVRYVYKETHDYKAMTSKFMNEKRHTLKGTMVLFYIIVSSVLLLALAIYAGSQS